MAIDALASVPLGQSGTGEAVVLKGNGFEDYTQKVLGIRAKEGEERKKTEAEIGKLLQDNIQSKWAQDNINYFQPATQALKDETIKMYKESNGKLDTVQLYGIQSKWNKLKEQATASNSLYEEELTRIKQIEEHPDKIDAEESNKIRQIYADPMSNPTTAKEVQALGGDIVKWRSLNARRFGNIASYDINSDLDKGFKDKQSEVYEKDKNGVLKFKQGAGGILIAKGLKGVDPEKIDTHYNTFWDRTNYDGKKFREAAATRASKEFNIEDNGSVTALTKDAADAQMQAPDLKGLNKDQKLATLAKAMGKVQVLARFPQTEVWKTEKPMNIKIDNSAGGGLGWKKFNWGGGTKAMDFKTLGEQGADGLDKEWKKYFIEEGKRDLPYVSFSVKLGEDNKDLTFKMPGGTETITSRGFYKNKDGNWVLIAEQEQGQYAVQEGQKQAKKAFRPTEVELSKANNETATDIATRLGFENAEQLKQHLEDTYAQKGSKTNSSKSNTNAGYTGKGPSYVPNSDFKGVRPGGF